MLQYSLAYEDYSEIYSRSRGSAPLLSDPGWDKDYPQNSEFNDPWETHAPNVYLVGGRAGRG